MKVDITKCKTQSLKPQRMLWWDARAADNVATDNKMVWETCATVIEFCLPNQDEVHSKIYYDKFSQFRRKYN